MENLMFYNVKVTIEVMVEAQSSTDALDEAEILLTPKGILAYVWDREITKVWKEQACEGEK